MLTLAWIRREDISTILPFLEMINEGTEPVILERRLKEMADAAYRCAGAFEGGHLVAICGVWTLYKHYVGKHFELDNVVVSPHARSRGIGEKLVLWLHNEAAREGCVAAELNCYVHNSPGVKFWLNQGYKILGFHFQKKW